jgi:hypothetical protein
MTKPGTPWEASLAKTYSAPPEEQKKKEKRQPSRLFMQSQADGFGGWAYPR